MEIYDILSMLLRFSSFCHFSNDIVTFCAIYSQEGSIFSLWSWFGGGGKAVLFLLSLSSHSNPRVFKSLAIELIWVFCPPPSLSWFTYIFRFNGVMGWWCCRSDYPRLCLFCCFVSQQSWFWAFHNFSNFSPPPPQVHLEGGRSWGGPQTSRAGKEQNETAGLGLEVGGGGYSAFFFNSFLNVHSPWTCYVITPSKSSLPRLGLVLLFWPFYI